MPVPLRPKMLEELRAMEMDLLGRQGDRHRPIDYEAYGKLHALKTDEIAQRYGMPAGIWRADSGYWWFHPITGGAWRGAPMNR